MDVLEEILDLRKKQVVRDKEKMSLSELESRIKMTAPGPDFLNAVGRPGKISIIAEMKRKSPSAGVIGDSYDVQKISSAYEKGGAAALSVLTEPERFGGTIEDFSKVRNSSTLPILRKDFLFDPYQIAEARAFGASAVLLIADMLEASQLKELAQYAEQLNLTALVEVFTPEAVSSALGTGSRLIGINTRNLRTLEMFPDNVAKISKMIPDERLIVAESGIKTADDIMRLKSFRVSAALVGESLLKRPNLEKATHELVEAGQ